VAGSAVAMSATQVSSVICILLPLSQLVVGSW
jgi:hypothetical protein